MAEKTAEGLKKLVHDCSTWQGRCAPLSTDALYAPTWRVRAEKHRSKVGLSAAGQTPIEASRCADAAPDRPDQSGDVLANVREADFICDPSGELAADLEALKEVKRMGDLWQSAMRVELEMYLLYKNARARLPSDQPDGEFVPLDTTAAWQIALDIAAAERDVLRHDDRSSTWPDVLRSISTLAPEDAKGFCQRLVQWIAELEELGDASPDLNVREALRLCPIAALLRQALSDFYVDAGDTSQATGALVGFGRTGLSLESPSDCNPAIAFWAQDLRCGYVKAHHHLRLGRLALLAADESVRDVPPYLLKQRSKQRCDKAAQARRELLSARADFSSELQYASLAVEGASLSRVDLELMHLALGCARMQAVALLGQACFILSRSDAVSLHEEAHGMACDLRRNPRATEQLRLLLIDEAYRLSARIHEIRGGPH